MCFSLINTGVRVSKMDNFRGVHSCKTRKNSSPYINIFPETHFEVQPPCSPNISSLGEHLKSLLYSAPIENEEIYHQCTFYACQTTRNHSGTCEMVRRSMTRRIHRSSWWTFRAFLLNCDLTNSKKSTAVKLRTLTLNALCQL